MKSTENSLSARETNAKKFPSKTFMLQGAAVLCQELGKKDRARKKIQLWYITYKLEQNMCRREVLQTPNCCLCQRKHRLCRKVEYLSHLGKWPSPFARYWLFVLLSKNTFVVPLNHQRGPFLWKGFDRGTLWLFLIYGIEEPLGESS